MVEARSPAKVVVDRPVRKRAVQQPGIVEGRVADPRVAPVDDAHEPAVAHEHVLRPEVGVDERRLEPGQRLDLGEERPRLRA